MRYTHTITIATAITTLLAMGSCKKQIDPTIELSQAEIVLTAGVPAGTIVPESRLSKASADPTQAMEIYFARADQDAGSAYGAYSTTPLVAARKAGKGFQEAVFAIKQFYLIHPRKTKLAGWYPKATVANKDSASWDIDGSQDVLTSQLQQGDARVAMPNITLAHQLSQLKFVPYAIDATTQDMFGKINKIEVIAQRTKCTYNFATSDTTGNAVFTGGNAIFSPANFTAAIAPVGKATATQTGDPVMIEPQAAGYRLNVQIQSEKMGAIKAVLDQEFVKGVSYIIYLKMEVKEITLQAAITDWGTPETVDTEYPNRLPLVTIGDVQWCATNLGGIGSNVFYTDNAEHYGAFFKWGTSKAYSRASGTIDGVWGTTTIGAATTPEASSTGGVGYDYVGLAGGEAPGDPCQKLGPEYKTPTKQQFLDLCASRGSVTSKPLQSLNGVSGLFFGPGSKDINVAQTSIPKGMIFLPAAGFRNWENGALIGVGTLGYYWSSSVYSIDRGWLLGFNDSSINLADNNNYQRSYGFSVRCVFIPPPPTVTITGNGRATKWLTANLTGTPGAAVGDVGKVGLSSKPEDYGMFFKWGTSKVYDRATSNTDGDWSGTTGGAATTPAASLTNLLGYDHVGLAGGEAPGDPCQKLGVEYKTPTYQQWADLCASRGSATTTGPQTLNEVSGVFFGPGALDINVAQTSVPAGMIFLPAAAERTDDGYYSGSGTSVGPGYYWSSSVFDADKGRCLAFYMTYNSISVDLDENRGGGLSVRCVFMPPPTPATVTIAGTKWLCGNLTASAQGATTGFTVEPTPQGLGYFWKWGSKHAYNRESGGLPSGHWGSAKADYNLGSATQPTTPSRGYDYANASGLMGPGGPVGDPCQALGASYRTPTQTQIKALHDSGKLNSQYQDVPGWFFGPSATSCNNSTLKADCIFLPAAGYRYCSGGGLYYVGSEGYYWSSSVYNADNGRDLNFYSSGSIYPEYNSYRGYGFSVRCVQE